MKKFGLVAVLLVISATFAFAQTGYGTSDTSSATASADKTDSMIVTGAVSQKLSVSLPNDYFNIGELGASGDTGVTYAAGSDIDFGNITIRSNIKKWSLKIDSLNGGLYTSQTPAGGGTTLEQTIGYTFTVGGDVNFSFAFLPTAKTNTVSVNRKTTGGASGETFAMKLNYNTTATNTDTAANWLSGTYHDTLTFTVSAL